MAEPDRHSLPIRRLLIMACVMTAGIAGLWMLIDHVSNVDVIDPTPPPPEPTTTSPAVDTTSTATPADDGAVPPRAGSLPDLLHYAPDRLADESLPLTDVGRYADIEGWMASRGIPVGGIVPGAPDDPALRAWQAELANLALPTSLAERALDPEWRQSYGFDLTHVHQVLVVGQAPDYVMILRGRFDPTQLQDAWVSSGYQAVEAEGTTIWTLFPGDTIDLSDPASRPAMGMLNNVVLLEDGTLVAAAKLPRLQSLLRVVNGTAPSLAENTSIASLFGQTTDSEDMVSAVISRGSLLESLPRDLPRPAAGTRPPDDSIARSVRTGVAGATLDVQMPEVDLVLFGILPPFSGDDGASPVAETPDSRSDPHVRLVLTFDDIEDARIAQQVIERRLHGYLSPVTGGAYGQRFGSPLVRVVDAPGDPALVAVATTLPRGANDWLSILGDRDMGFAFWLGPSASRDD